MLEKQVLSPTLETLEMASQSPSTNLPVGSSLAQCGRESQPGNSSRKQWALQGHRQKSLKPSAQASEPYEIGAQGYGDGSVGKVFSFKHKNWSWIPKTDVKARRADVHVMSQLWGLRLKQIPKVHGQLAQVIRNILQQCETVPQNETCKSEH